MESVLNGLERVIFDAGDLLFSEGDKSYFFFIIEQGEVEVFLPKTKSTPEVHLATLSEGYPVGEFALVVKKTRSASARAKTPCTAIKISEDSYKTLLKELPAWSISVIQSLIERLRKTDEMLRDQSVQKALMLAQIEKILK
jgi:CPA1 family monovalent cation:H+ antiporter